jgi:hypothetical protein
MAPHLVRLSLVQRRRRQGPSPRHAQTVCWRPRLAGTVDGKRQPMGIVNFDDRFGAASSADQLARSDPKAPVAIFSSNDRSTLETDVRRPRREDQSSATAVTRGCQPKPETKSQLNGCIRESRTGALHSLRYYRPRNSVSQSCRPTEIPGGRACEPGRGTSTASHYMNSSGDITKCVVPSRQAVFSVSTTCPAALHCTRSLASAERVM